MSDLAYEVVQWLVLMLYFLTIYNASNIMYKAHVLEGYDSIKLVCFLMGLLMFSQSSLYIHLQIEWILEDIGGTIEEEADVEWLIYDYLTGFTVFTMSHITKIVLSLRHKQRKGEDRRGVL